MNMSDDLEGKLKAHMFRTATYAKPSVIALCLTSDIPTDATTGSSPIEIGTGGYLRQTLNPADANWSSDNSTSGMVFNNAPFTFPQCTGVAYGNISGILITDNATNGAGNAMFWAALATPQFIGVTNQFVVPVSGLSVQLDN